MNKFKMVLGDWSQDGHNQTEDYIIETDLTDPELGEAVRAAEIFTGVALHKLCEEYEDNLIPSKDYNKLKDCGIDISTFDSYGELQEDGYCISCDGFAELIVRMVKLGNPSCICKVVPSEPETYSLRGYGYGLFQ